jgi:hypothetical protein
MDRLTLPCADLNTKHHVTPKVRTTSDGSGAHRARLLVRGSTVPLRARPAQPPRPTAGGRRQTNKPVTCIAAVHDNPHPAVDGDHLVHEDTDGKLQAAVRPGPGPEIALSRGFARAPQPSLGDGPRGQSSPRPGRQSPTRNLLGRQRLA